MSGQHEQRASRSRTWLRRFGALAGKELRLFARDRAFLVFLVYAFTLSVYLAATGISLELRDAATRVLDSDHTHASRELTYRFQSPYFNVLPDDDASTRGAAGTSELDRGSAMVVVDVPAGFEAALLEGREAGVQMQLDATNSTLGFLAGGYGQRITARYAEELAARRAHAEFGASELPQIDGRDRYWFNPALRSEPYQALEQLAKMILLFSMLLPAAAMAREKEHGTIEQLLVSPVTPTQILLSKVVPMAAVIVVAAIVCRYAIIEGVLGIPLRGSAMLFFTMTAVYSFACSGLGLLIASWTRNVAQVGLVSILCMPPLLLLSGGYTPPEMMPELLRPLMYASPLYHFQNLMLGILLKGAGLSLLWDSALWLLAVGGSVFALGVVRFRRQFR